MFDKYCIDKIQKGEKTITRRLPSKSGRRSAVPGTIHKLKVDRTEKTFGSILINSCSLTLVKDIDDKEAIKEGFNNRKEYIDYFMDINNIDMLSDYDMIWRVRFTYLGDDLNDS